MLKNGPYTYWMPFNRYKLAQANGQSSLGQRKRIFLSVSLLSALPLWILDEPSNGLDHESLAVVTELIKEHGKNNLVIMASHDENFIRETAAQKIVMYKYEGVN